MSAGVTRTAIGTGIWSNGIIQSASGGFKFPDGTVQTTASTGLTGAVRTDVAGDWNIAASTVNSAYSYGAFEIREANFAGAQTGVASEAPRIAFLWAGRVASQIGMDASGVIRTYNNPGTAYEGFAASTITSSGGNGFYAPVNSSYLGHSNGYNYLRGSTYAFTAAWYDETNSAYYVDPSATSIYNDLRANIFYDQGNTGYYLDPASTSNLSTVNVQGVLTANAGINDSAGARMDAGGGWFRTYGTAGWYNGTYSVGMYATETGYVTTYNSAGVKANSFVYVSDERLKKDIVPLQSSLENVRSLNGYTFNWKKDNKADIGVIAQEVEKVFPQLVHTDPEGYKSVEYGNLVAPLIEAVKELANSLDALATRVFNTESRQTELELRLQTQQAQIDLLQKQLGELSKKK
jgi:hypothetical protein